MKVQGLNPLVGGHEIPLESKEEKKKEMVFFLFLRPLVTSNLEQTWIKSGYGPLLHMCGHRDFQTDIHLYFGNSTTIIFSLIKRNTPHPLNCLLSLSFFFLDKERKLMHTPR